METTLITLSLRALEVIMISILAKPLPFQPLQLIMKMRKQPEVDMDIKFKDQMG